MKNAGEACDYCIAFYVFKYCTGFTFATRALSSIALD